VMPRPYSSPHAPNTPHHPPRHRLPRHEPRLPTIPFIWRDECAVRTSKPHPVRVSYPPSGRISPSLSNFPGDTRPNRKRGTQRPYSPLQNRENLADTAILWVL